ncbi:hypothetical protein DFH28DRAFT_1046878, partial [Melampsora americana]
MQEVEGINQIKAQLIPITHEHEPMGFRTFANSELSAPIEHQDQHDEVDFNSVFQHTTDNDGIRGNNQLSLYGSAPNDIMGSTGVNLEPPQISFNELPLDIDTMSWSQIWHKSSLSTESTGRRVLGHHSHIPPTDSFTEYNSPPYVYEEMSHIPIHMAHQTFDDIFEKGYFNSEEPNHIVQAFTNSNDQSLEHISPNGVLSSSNQKKSPQIGLDRTGSFGECGYQINSNEPSHQHFYDSYHSDFPGNLNPKESERFIGGPDSDTLNRPPTMSTSPTSPPVLDEIFSLPLHHAIFDQEGPNTVFEHHNIPSHWPQSGVTQFRDIPHGKEGSFKSGKPSSQPPYNVREKYSEGQEKVSSKSSQNYFQLKRKASDIVTTNHNEAAHKAPKKDKNGHPNDLAFEIGIMRLVKEMNDKVRTKLGVHRRDTVQTIQDVGMNIIQSHEGLNLLHQKWWSSWKDRVLHLIDSLGHPSNSIAVTKTSLMSAINKVEHGIVMGFLGILTLIESHMTEKPVMFNSLD